eukprot:TRINITY_DN5611_c1_g1_i1.p1 TRINITY_DN5611_c1_g1~~TRINITY_DN5611_c1_g1_i1.p1  ORF type:complete len:434 (+),score=29.10 TRINITY_DN5611_c1_g1_i1:540-1841(+)
MRAPFSVQSVLPSMRHHFLSSMDLTIWLCRNHLPRPVFGPFYPDGWGCYDVPRIYGHEIGDPNSGMRRPLPSMKVPKVSLHSVPTPWRDIFLVEGSFRAPVLDEVNPHHLPPECHSSWFELVLPSSCVQQSGSSACIKLPAKGCGVAILLAATGQHGYVMRRKLVAHALARQGIASVILESPFYGKRQPKDQRGSKLRRVSDLPVLGRATLYECRSLIRWLLAAGFGPVSLAGASMGGLHAAMTACLTPSYPLGVVSWAGPPSASPVFAQGLLSYSCAWASLGADAKANNLEAALAEPQSPYPIPESLQGQDESTYLRQLMWRFLQLTDIEKFPEPTCPEGAIFVHARRDWYVPDLEETMRRFASRFSGCEQRVRDGGHISCSALPTPEFSGTIAKSLEIVSQHPLANSHQQWDDAAAREVLLCVPPAVRTAK